MSISLKWYRCSGLLVPYNIRTYKYHFPQFHRICIEFASNLQRRKSGGKSKQSLEIKGLKNKE